MKALLIFLVTCFGAVSIYAQNSAVTVTINGNLNKQVYVDGVNYPFTTDASSSASGRLNTALIENVAVGQHSLQIVNINQTNTNRRNERIFNTRSGYDLAITVNGNGNVTLSETRRRRNRNGSGTGTYNTSMSDVNFSVLVNDVRSTYQSSSRAAKINTAFRTNGNYFTSSQVGQLLQLVNGDSYRLPLAKSAYRTVTDPANFSSLYSLLRTQNSRNDLAAYVSTNSSQNTNGTGTNTYNQAMSDVNFRSIYNDIQSRYQMGSKVNALNAIFMTTGNYFSTNQVAQILQLIGDENERFQLTKVAYRAVVNPANYTSIINSFSTQARRDELAYFVRSFDPRNPGPGYTYGGATSTVTGNVAMSDVNFSTLYDNIRRQWLPGAKKSTILETFANTANYFTSTQVRTLVGLDNNEADRLDMAKASYRSIIDPANFSLLYDLFTVQSRRDELAAYIRSYSTGSTTGSTTDVYTSPTTKTPMMDASFTELYNQLRSQWLPGAKKSGVLTAFSNINNYFSTAQAIRLISLDNDEPDRLDMAKASLRSIADPGNVRQIIDVFTSQASRDDISNYINSYRW
ncbi:MAG: DUF4476 domain-containing protein [Ferruginibacter sp.]